MEDESYNQYIQTSGNEAPSSLQIRLKTDETLERIEIFLRGLKKEHVLNEDTGKLEIKIAEAGERLCNDKGIQAIMNLVSTLINPQVGQGNFTRVMYDQFIEEVNIGLATDLVVNCEDWGIKDQNLSVITNSIMGILIPFMSRLIDDGERKSYVHTLKSVENNTIREEQPKKGLFRL